MFVLRPRSSPTCFNINISTRGEAADGDGEHRMMISDKKPGASWGHARRDADGMRMGCDLDGGGFHKESRTGMRGSGC
jgi:hypothetical protein